VKYIKNLAIFFLFSNLVFLLSCTNKNNQDDLYKEILEKVYQIDKSSFTQVITLSNEQFLDNMTDGGGELIFYIIGNNVVKIKETIGLSYEVNTTNFYIDNDSLIYANLITERYLYDTNSGEFIYTVLNKIGEWNYYKDKSGKMVSDSISKESNEKIIGVEDKFVSYLNKYKQLKK